MWLFFHFYIQKMIDNFSKYHLWKYDSEFDNTQLLNSFSMTVFLQPLIEYTEVKCTKSDGNINFMNLFKGGKNFKKTLRLLGTEKIQEKEKEGQKEDKLLFCIPEKNEIINIKRFSLYSYDPQTETGVKTTLLLDQPNKVLVIKTDVLVAIQKKCITLYKITNEQLSLKDYDSIGIGNRLIVTDIRHLKYKKRDYLLIFGNEKQEVNSFFKCLVYQISQEKLNFIKKATLFHRETYKPIILFDKYPGNQYNDEQFCLVLGGYSDYEQKNYIFGALQIHLHLLLQEWIHYPIKLTHQIEFNQKHTITAGKAIKISNQIVNDECWLLFCTQYQTLTKMYMQFGHGSSDQLTIDKINLHTKTFKVKTEKKGEIESMFYAENTIYLVKNNTSFLPKEIIGEIPYKIAWCDKKMQNIRSRPLDEILRLFASQ